MFLCDKDIKQAVMKGEITLQNFDEKRLQMATYDVKLGNRFVIMDNHSIHFTDPVRSIFPHSTEIFIEYYEEFILHPGVCVLGEVADFVGCTTNYLIQISGKSSLARLGLIVHNTAGIINPGHYLNIVLELSNVSSIPIVLRPGMLIAQLLFSQLSSTPENSYNQKGRFSSDNWNNFTPAK
jgi:dCTP deaminase